MHAVVAATQQHLYHHTTGHADSNVDQSGSRLVTFTRCVMRGEATPAIEDQCYFQLSPGGGDFHPQNPKFPSPRKTPKIQKTFKMHRINPLYPPPKTWCLELTLGSIEHPDNRQLRSYVKRESRTRSPKLRSRSHDLRIYHLALVIRRMLRVDSLLLCEVYSV